MRILLFLFLVFGFSVNANGLLGYEESSPVVAVGEVVLTSSMTVDDGYRSAESLAKINASKGIGEYFQVVSVFDEKTGQRNESLATVTASVMKYKVLRRELRTEESDVVAVVEIEAYVSQADLETAMQRYMDETSYRNEVIAAQQRISELEKEAYEGREALNEVRRLEVELEKKSSELKAKELTRQLVVARNKWQTLSQRAKAALVDYEDSLLKIASVKKVERKMNMTVKRDFQAESKAQINAKERAEMDAFAPRLQSWLDIIGVEAQPEIYKENFSEDQLRVVLKLDLKLNSKEFLNAYDGYLRGAIRQAAPKYSRDRRYFRATSKSAAARYVIYAKLTVNGQSRALPMVYSVMSGGTGDCTKDVRPKVVGTGFGYDLCFVEGRYGTSDTHAPGYESPHLFNFEITENMDLSNIDVKVDFDVVELY